MCSLSNPSSLVGRQINCDDDDDVVAIYSDGLFAIFTVITCMMVVEDAVDELAIEAASTM